jgi:hypothetical protein
VKHDVERNMVPFVAFNVGTTTHLHLAEFFPLYRRSSRARHVSTLRHAGQTHSRSRIHKLLAAPVSSAEPTTTAPRKRGPKPKAPVPADLPTVRTTVDINQCHQETLCKRHRLMLCWPAAAWPIRTNTAAIVHNWWYRTPHWRLRWVWRERMFISCYISA